MSQEIISLQNITFGYEEGKSILEEFNLTVNKGEFVAILGHNGSGKSTLSKLLVGLLMPQHGNIIIGNQELREDNIFEIRQKLAIVFQNPDNQFVGSTVRDDIAFGLENKCIPHDEMSDLVAIYAKKVGMSRYLDREPQHLSGGEKQRVAIAGGLALGAEILILDESTAMLDPLGRQEIMGLIQEIAATKEKTILMITHHLDEAIFSDRIVVMNQGKILLDGSPKEVFANKGLLESVKLDVPFAVKASHELVERGILKTVCTDDEELMTLLWTLDLKA
ncbi:MAG: energy-coupling factor transporter ATPase [Turicibacter sp.]|nr:energy-coupling factor transporter ATPase [Turicibacter sp.]